MDSFISRQAALEAIDSVLVEDESCKVWFKLAVKNLPSVQPERKRGKWTYSPSAFHPFGTCDCSVCGKKSEYYYNFCP